MESGPAWWASGASDFDAVADFELGEPAEVEHLGEVVFAAEGGEHAGEVAEGGGLGAEPLADVFAGGGAAEVFVAAAAGGLRGRSGARPILRSSDGAPVQSRPRDGCCSP